MHEMDWGGGGECRKPGWAEKKSRKKKKRGGGSQCCLLDVKLVSSLWSGLYFSREARNTDFYGNSSNFKMLGSNSEIS